MATSLLSYFCCCHYSMGCEGDKKERACVTSAVLFVTSWGCYVIMLALGWLFFATVPQENHGQLAFATVIIISIPFTVVALVVRIFLKCPTADCKNWFRTRGALWCLIGVEMVAGVIKFAGVILFIAASATLDMNDPYALVYGVCAGVFGITAGVTNILSQSCCCPYNCFGFCQEQSDLTNDEEM